MGVLRPLMVEFRSLGDNFRLLEVGLDSKSVGMENSFMFAPNSSHGCFFVS